MVANRWERIEQIFNEAIAIPSDKRNSFVEKACGLDADLCFEVSSLLEADDQSDEVLERSVFPLFAQLMDDDFSQLLEKGDFASYKLKKLLGKGGMGAVFLAEDTGLERFVALKILPSAIADNSETAMRFQQEAKAISAVSHQNVAHIYEFGRYEGMYFFTMEYIPGKTLRELLDEKQVDVFTAVEIALQTAYALEAAHAEDITHRDIKPENIMLRQRAVATKEVFIKVLDFGIAKLNQGSRHRGNLFFDTLPGLIMGTTAYMSPEQVRGETVDERTDLWSLGVVLYEMISGTRPFEGETASDVQAAILLKELLPLELAAELPYLDKILEKALAKDVASRYQSAKEIIFELRSLQRQVYDYIQLNDEQKTLERSSSPIIGQIETNPRENVVATVGNRAPVKQSAITSSLQPSSNTKPSAKKINRYALIGFALIFTTLLFSVVATIYSSYFSRKADISSIAVLPFVNVGGDANTEYLSDGISESLINSLSRLSGVKVIARNSAFRFKGKDADLQETAKALGVETILTGRIARQADDYLIDVALVDARDGTQMWGEQYNPKAKDMQRVQSEIFRKIADKLRLRLNRVQEQQFAKRESANPEAYELLLKGRFFSRKGGKDNLKKSIEYFKQAITIDSNYAPAYSDLSTNYIILVNNSVLNPQEFIPKAEAAARKALELDENSADAHYALAQIRRSAWEWTEAEHEYKRAIELNPNLAKAHSGYAFYLVFVDRPDEALAENKISKDLDPASLSNYTDTGNINYLSRRYEAAIEALKNALEMDQSYSTAYVYFGYVYTAKGMYGEAITSYQKAIELNGETTSRQIFLGAAYAKAGMRGKALDILNQLETGKEYASPCELAILYAALDMREKAFVSLEKAYAAHDLQMQYIGVDPAFDALRDDARFQDLIKRVGIFL